MKFMVAFSSPKRSTPLINAAALMARECQAELILLRVLPDAEKVGVVAQLIATDRPKETAHRQVDQVVAKLKEKGINARGEVRTGEVGPGLVQAACELEVNLLFVGTLNLHTKPKFYMARDPIVHYLVDNCPISLCLIRLDDPLGTSGIFDASALESVDEN